MPAGAGEVLLTTLFADVHYFFSPPTSKPQHHRFDCGSYVYVYVYHNAVEHRSKLEVANHAGTPDQDAFSGLLDFTSVRYSYKQPTLCTLVVDGGRLQGHDQWHLPSYNESNEQKYLYKIHTIDIYLWTEKDAATFLGHLKAIVPADKLDIRDAPSTVGNPAEHRDSMSPVVQQLERTAIGNHSIARTGSTTSGSSLPGPPTPAASIGATASPQPAPMAYNPAAPAAPEPISHREKTPPPPDAGQGTGLMTPNSYDFMPQTQFASVPTTFQTSNQQTSQQACSPHQQQQPMRSTSSPSFPGPPQGTLPAQSGTLPPPPPPPSDPSPLQYAPSFAGPPQQPQTAQPTSPPPTQQSFQRQSTFGSGQPIQQYATYSNATPSFGPTAISSPGFGPAAHHLGQQPPAYSSPGVPPNNYQQEQLQHQSHLQSQQQTFNYSSYSYTASQQPQSYTSQGAYSGDVHSQVYRPTAAEAGSHGHRPQQQGRQNSETRTKLEGKVRDVEGRVGGYLKKLDTLW